MRKIKVLIVDDESAARNYLESIVKTYDNIGVVDTAASVDEAISCITHSLPDLVFLDVQMPVKSGFDLLDELKLLNIDYPEFVFVTAYNEFALKALKCSAFDFLLKPIDFDELEKTIRKFQTKTLKSDFLKKIDSLYDNLYQNKKLKITTRYGFMTVNPNDIIYCSANGSYTDVFFENSKTEVFTNHLAVLEEMLPATNFFRISRSQIINTNFLFSVIRKEKACILRDRDNDIKLFISSGKVKELENFF